MTPGHDEFKTIRITPASATRRKSYARKRSRELAAIQEDGWEIVDVEPERLLRPGDKVTARRIVTPDQLPPGVFPPSRESPLPIGGDGTKLTWSSFTTRGKVILVVGALALLALILSPIIDSASSQPSVEHPIDNRPADPAGPSMGYAEVICERAVSDRLYSTEADFDSESTTSGQTVYVTGAAETLGAFGVPVEVSYACVAEGESDDLTLTSVDIRD